MNASDKSEINRSFTKATDGEIGQRLVERARTQSDANRYRFLLSSREKDVVNEVRRKTSFGNKTGSSSGTTTKSGDSLRI